MIDRISYRIKDSFEYIIGKALGPRKGALKVARVGLGVPFLEKALIKSRNFKVIGGYDIVKKGRFSNFEALLKSNAEAVIISTPNQFHYSQVIECAKHGKHVFVEKPIALDTKEAKRVIKLETTRHKFKVRMKTTTKDKVRGVRVWRVE